MRLPFALSKNERAIMKKKNTDMSQGMLDLRILRSLRGGTLNGRDEMNRIRIVSGEVFRLIPIISANERRLEC
jgi:hypothetical protein